jgi:hypothetical protein
MSRGKMKRKLELSIRLISHIYVALENICNYGDINRASEDGENIKNSAKCDLCLHKQKHCKLCCDDEFSVRIIVGVNVNFYNSILSVSCAVVMKSGNLNFLEPSGPLEACNGTTLPLPLPVLSVCSSDDSVYNS